MSYQRPIPITVSGYRCFGNSNALSFVLADGMTALVGPNNAGKSAVLRLFYDLRDVANRFKNRANWLADLNNHQVRPVFPKADDVGDSKFTDYAEAKQIRLSIGPIDSNPASIGTIEAPRHIDIDILPTGHTSLSVRDDAPGFRVDRDSIWMEHVNGTIIKMNSKDTLDLSHWEQVFADLATIIYIPAFRNAINSGTEESRHFDVLVGSHFVRQWDSVKRNAAKRTGRRRIADITEEIRRLFGFNSLEINASQDHSTLLLTINGSPYRLDEVGSGIAQAILALAAVTKRRPSWIAIDEPELNLHPSMQGEFIDMLAKRASRGVLMATHSIGLSRATGARSYSMNRDADGLVRIRPLESTPRLSEFIGLMSYSGSAGLGYEAVLLVEGVHDVRVAREWLRHVRLDHRVVVWPLGGESLIDKNREFELQEVRRVCSSVFVLIDSERRSPDDEMPHKRAQFVAMCHANGFHAHVMEKRCIESYFPQRAIDAAFPNCNFVAHAEFQESRPSWGKASNWCIAAQMDAGEVLRNDVGEFLMSMTVTIDKARQSSS